jgi:hypothetical protein
VAYTKKIARHDKITIDGTDVSNSFREFGRPSEDAQEDVSGFSASGVDEFLPGGRNQRFEGEAFYTEELALLVEPLYNTRDADVVVTWQPDGLLDATREIYSGTGSITEFGPSNTRGSVSTFRFVFVPNSSGITVGNWT